MGKGHDNRIKPDVDQEPTETIFLRQESSSQTRNSFLTDTW